MYYIYLIIEYLKIRNEEVNEESIESIESIEESIGSVEKNEEIGENLKNLSFNDSFTLNLLPLTLFCCASYAFMLPFALSELMLMCEYKLAWISFWNISFLTSFILQVI